MSTKLFEIAEKAGFSTATVSRAINHPEMVSKRTLERVQKIIREIDYTPPPKGRNRGPKGPRKTRANLQTIAVWFVSNWQSLQNPMQDRLIVNFQRAFEKRGYSAMIVSSASPDEVPAEILGKPVNGLVLQGLLPGAESLKRFSSTPKIWMMTRRDPHYEGDYVEPDNAANGRLAAKYLFGLGHRKLVAVISDLDYPAFAQRYAAFREAAQQMDCKLDLIAGPKMDTPAVPNQHLQHTVIKQLAKDFGALNDTPRGYYFCSDFTTAHMLQALPLLGLKMHKQASIIAGDYNPVLHYQSGTLLACINIHLETIIEKTAEQLCWRISNPDAGGWVGTTVSPSIVEPA